MTTAKTLHEAMFMDVWPTTAVIVDFGLDGSFGSSPPQRVYRAYQLAVKRGDVTVSELEEAMSNNTLQELIRDRQPDKEVCIRTVWNDLSDASECDDDEAAEFQDSQVDM